MNAGAQSQPNVKPLENDLILTERIDEKLLAWSKIQGIVNKSDYIQATIALIYLVILVFILFQLIIQNRIFRAQVLRDRFEMYWKIWEPVSDAQVNELRLYPDDYLSKDKYESQYRNDEKALRKYIYMLNVYEYLAFSYATRRLSLPEPLGRKWTTRWLSDLVEEQTFLDVHEYHKPFYPEIAAFIDKLLAQRANAGTRSQAKPSGLA